MHTHCLTLLTRDREDSISCCCCWMWLLCSAMVTSAPRSPPWVSLGWHLTSGTSLHVPYSGHILSAAETRAWNKTTQTALGPVEGGSQGHHPGLLTPLVLQLPGAPAACEGKAHRAHPTPAGSVPPLQGAGPQRCLQLSPPRTTLLPLAHAASQAWHGTLPTTAQPWSCSEDNA